MHVVLSRYFFTILTQTNKQKHVFVTVVAVSVSLELITEETFLKKHTFLNDFNKINKKNFIGLRRYQTEIHKS